MGAVWAILRKECLAEWRSRYGLNAALLFAVASLSAVSFTANRLTDRPDVLAALLWVVLLFATLASLAHAFVREVDGHTLLLLRQVASPTQIALGKFAFNLVFLAVIEGVTVPLFFIFMSPPATQPVVFGTLLALGSVSLAAAGTLLGAVVAQSRGRGALFAGISLPLLLPVLIAAASGTRAQWVGASAAMELRVLAAFGLALAGVGLLLYDHLWD